MENKTQSYYMNIRPEMVDLIHGTPRRILEIGCGTGCFRKNFCGEVEYWGVEPCEEAAHQAGRVLTKILNGTYNNTKSGIPSHYFDLIVCNDVIEHMTDPEDFLRDIKNKVTNNGSMIVSIPNLRNAVTLYNLLIKGDFQYGSSGVLDYTHYHLFTKKSFVHMVTECGWDVELCKPLSSPPFKTLKNIILNCIKPFIPEIKSLQIAVRLRPSNANQKTNLKNEE